MANKRAHRLIDTLAIGAMYAKRQTTLPYANTIFSETTKWRTMEGAANYRILNRISSGYRLYAMDNEVEKLLVSWRLRTAWNFVTGAYTPLDLDKLSLQLNLAMFLDHWVHVDKTDKTKIAYYACEEHAIADRKTITTLGRYLTAFYSHRYTADEIRDIAAAFTSAKRRVSYKILTTADEIEQAYTNGPRSCMSYTAGNYSSGIHPTRVYGSDNGSDLDLLVLLNPATGRVTARTLVVTKDKIHGRIYGDAVAMRELLHTLGYRHGSFVGYKINKIHHRHDEYVMPYIDAYNDECDTSSNGAAYVSDQGDYFKITTHDNGSEACRTSGILEIETYENCSVCDRRHLTSEMCILVDTDEPACQCCVENARVLHIRGANSTGYYRTPPTNTFYNAATCQLEAGEHITLSEHYYPARHGFPQGLINDTYTTNHNGHVVRSVDLIHIPEIITSTETYPATTCMQDELTHTLSVNIQGTHVTLFATAQPIIANVTDIFQARQ